MEVPHVNQNARRRVLYSAICAICHECGFGNAEKIVLETLLEMLQSLICEIGRNGRAFCELSGRTEPLVGDVVMALIDAGISLDNIPSYAMRPTRVSIPSPAQMPKQSLPKILQAGEKKTLSHYIPDHFPPFPDPHAYIWTPTHKQPVTEYEAIREKSATQKRDVERALTRFMAKTCEKSVTQSLFADDAMFLLFPLITLKIECNSYLNALIPKDQIFDDEEEDDRRMKRKESEKKNKNVQISENNNNEKTIVSNESEDANNSETKPLSSNAASDIELFDNPYLRPAKVSKKRTRKQAFE